MTSNFDYCAEQYEGVVEMPWVKYADFYSLHTMMGNLAGQTILDLGCGEGLLARLMKQQGAGEVLGVDMSAEMIKIALEKENRTPLGINYLCQDITCLNLNNQLFDKVVASFLLSLASTQETLFKMVVAAFSHLKPGGSFYIADDNMDLSPQLYPLTAKYGFTKNIKGRELVEGTPIFYQVHTKTNMIEVEAAYIPLPIWEAKLKQAGFQKVIRHAPKISPEGISLFGKTYWDDYVQTPLDVYIQAIK